MEEGKNVGEENGNSQFQAFTPKLLKTKPISLTSNSLNMTLWQNDAENGTLEQEMSQGHNASLTIPTKEEGLQLNVQPKDKSRLEATFTHPSEPLEHKQNGGSPTKKYQALEFASASTNSTSITLDGEDKHLTKTLPEDERVLEAFLAFALSLFGPLWSLGLAYLHVFNEGKIQAGILNMIVLCFFIVVLHFSYFGAKISPKKQIWKSSKIVWFLCLIPGLSCIVLSFCNLIFAIKESQSRSYERPWGNTRYLFLAESLSHAFPQTVLHLILLVEDPSSMYTYPGYTILVGIVTFSFSITFARFRYDSQNKVEGFGLSFEKYVRFCYLWANKWLWLVTFALTILCARIAFPSHQTVTLCTSLFIIIAVHEIPLLLFMCLRSSNILGGLMMHPQFVSLIVLLVWINLDPNVYAMDSSSMVLGIFFWAEIIILTGWLYDRCTGREIEFLSFYPHFFGDLTTNIGQ